LGVYVMYFPFKDLKRDDDVRPVIPCRRLVCTEEDWDKLMKSEEKRIHYKADRAYVFWEIRNYCKVRMGMVDDSVIGGKAVHYWNDGFPIVGTVDIVVKLKEKHYEVVFGRDEASSAVRQVSVAP